MLIDAWSMICARHREETLTFLTVKTAAVRCGAKPAELLRVPVSAPQAAGGRSRGVCAALGLPHRILREDAASDLLLFYHPERLAEALGRPRAAAFLGARGWPAAAGAEAMLDELARRWEAGPTHEVGFFLGYPPKDVAGFLHAAPEVTRPGDRWRVFGEEGESRRLMRLHRALELRATAVCVRDPSPATRFRRIRAFGFEKTPVRTTQRKGA